MALASAPVTPERGVRSPLISRSFTAPIKTARSSFATQQAEAQGAETLFAHNAAKIVAFSTSLISGRRHSSVSDGRLDFRDEVPGSLPWASLTERTIAAGPLRIYRVLGSVAFLSSGTTLHPILAKSQCWCVDGISKFVLRIRANSYYRIELPYANHGDEEQVERLKDVLGKLLQYEKTPCPFKRGFTVDLPEPPPIPIQKKPWKPKPKKALAHCESASSDEDYSAALRKDRGSTESVTEMKDVQQNRLPESRTRARVSGDNSDNDSIVSVEKGIDPETANSESFMQNDLFEQSQHESTYMKTPIRPSRIITGRTVTAPPQLSLRNSPPSSKPTLTRTTPEIKQESPSISSSVDSFYSFHSPISPLPLSPPSPGLDTHDSADMNGAIPRTRGHKRDESETTVTTDPHPLWDFGRAESESISDRPRTPALVSDIASQDDLWDEVQTPSPPGLRVRRTLQKRRTHSPLPASANLYTPYPPSRGMSGRHLTTALLQRTCSLLLGPPLQLVALMLRIAARIARGAFQGSSYGYGDGGEKIPCTWDFSSDGSESSEDFWDEDDYGVSLTKTTSSKEIKSKDVGGSWEID